MPTITIAGQVIDFPSDGASPDWSPAIIQFAQACELAFSASAAGPNDVPPYIYTMLSNANTTTALPNLLFPTSTVMSANIRYSVSRVTSSDSYYEAGNIIIDYEPDNTLGNKWSISQEYINSFGTLTSESIALAQPIFTINDVGQLFYSTSAIAGNPDSHVGLISYAAQALINSNS